jgi:UDP-glucose 4-epimerase
MKIIITGGAGFIGSHLADFLLNKDYKVIIIDDLSTGNIDNINHVINRIDFIKEKVENVNLNMLGQVDAVVHLAAQASVPLSISDFKNSSTTNLISTVNIINYCSQNNIPLVYASSSAIYGDLPIGSDEVKIVDLLSPYATDKFVMELYAMVANKLYKLSSIGLRFFNVYGPRQDPSSPYSGVISIFIDRLLMKKGITINGGQQTRDFIYVNDVVMSIYHSLNLTINNIICEQVNILTGKSISIDNIAEMLIEEIGVEVEKNYKDLPLGDPLQSNGTPNKMMDMFESLDRTPLKIGLKETIDFIRGKRSKCQ